MAHTPTDGHAQTRLFSNRAFDGFGPSRFRPADEAVVGRQLRASRTGRLRKGVRAHAPRTPGVYGMIDGRGRLIYIGKAKNLRVRLLCYFRAKSRDPKAGKIIQHTRMLLWEQTGDEFAALLRELELIQTHRPRFNVLGVPGLQRHHYLCVGKSPAPHVYIVNKPDRQGTRRLRPARRPREVGGRRAPAQRLVPASRLSANGHALVRRSAASYSRKTAHRSACGYELGTCRGPCVAACSRQEYSSGVRAAKAFLDGRDRTILAKIEGDDAGIGRIVPVREGDGPS